MNAQKIESPLNGKSAPGRVFANNVSISIGDSVEIAGNRHPHHGEHGFIKSVSDEGNHWLVDLGKGKSAYVFDRRELLLCSATSNNSAHAEATSICDRI
jgi:hypothetical protein